MPLHLLGKKSWNVYNPVNIARVKADEAAAEAREAAEDQRMQELDASRRAAILRGQTPPPLPEDDKSPNEKRRRDDKGRDSHDRKRARKLRGEDDTDRDIRLARRDPTDEDVAILKLRKPKDDAPLTDHAGNINLFPVDPKEAVKLQKNAEAEKEKKKKERALEDQYTMRLANAAGKDGFVEQPWYTAAGTRAPKDDQAGHHETPLLETGFGDKDVWGNEDPRRKERQQARIASNDPLAFMSQAQAQLKKARQDKKKWAEERERELMELRAAEEREERRHRRRKRKVEEDHAGSYRGGGRVEQDSSPRHRHRHRSRSRSPDRKEERKSSHRRDRSRSRSREREHRHIRDERRRHS